MLEAILARLRDQPSRTGSLIITLYGDAIAPRGGTLWLGSLFVLFRAIGVADGVVRTAVSRLAGDGWLERSRVGRNSFYRLTARASRDTEAATSRIYGRPTPPWNGGLRLALVEPGPERDAVRTALTEAGYGTASPGLMVAPDTAAMPAGEGVLVLTARAEVAEGQRLARRAWPLDDVAGRYRTFLNTFLEADLPCDPQEAMLARMVLIHEWRRVVLRDPLLPAPLLAADWPGHFARQRVAWLYQGLYAASERWLDANGVCKTGALPRADATRRVFATP